MLKSLILALGLLATASTSRAQGSEDYTHVIAQVGKVQFINHHPNCNPLAKDFDPVWVNGWGWTMPRIGWWVMYPTLTIGIAEGLHKVGFNHFWSAAVATTIVGVAPVARQAALGLRHGAVYQFNLPDKLFDLHNRNLPAYHFLSENHGHSKKELVVWAAGDVALACFARP